MKNFTTFNLKERAKSPKQPYLKKDNSKSKAKSITSSNQGHQQNKSNCFDEYLGLQIDRYNEHQIIVEDQEQDLFLNQDMIVQLTKNKNLQEIEEIETERQLRPNPSVPLMSCSPKQQNGMYFNQQYMQDVFNKLNSKEVIIKKLQTTINNLEEEHKEKFLIVLEINEHLRRQIEIFEKNPCTSSNKSTHRTVQSPSRLRLQQITKRNPSLSGERMESTSPNKSYISSNVFQKKSIACQTDKSYTTVKKDLDLALIKIELLEQAKFQLLKLLDAQPKRNSQINVDAIQQSTVNSDKKLKGVKPTLERELEILARGLRIKQDCSPIDKVKRIGMLFSEQELQMKQLQKIAQSKSSSMAQTNNDGDNFDSNEDCFGEILNQVRILKDNFLLAFRGLDDSNPNLFSQDNSQKQYQKNSLSCQIQLIVTDLNNLLKKSVLLDLNVILSLISKDFRVLRSKKGNGGLSPVHSYQSEPSSKYESNNETLETLYSQANVVNQLLNEKLNQQLLTNGELLLKIKAQDEQIVSQEKVKSQNPKVKTQLDQTMQIEIKQLKESNLKYRKQLDENLNSKSQDQKQFKELQFLCIKKSEQISFQQQEIITKSKVIDEQREKLNQQLSTNVQDPQTQDQVSILQEQLNRSKTQEVQLKIDLKMLQEEHQQSNFLNDKQNKEIQNQQTILIETINNQNKQQQKQLNNEILKLVNEQANNPDAKQLGNSLMMVKCLEQQVKVNQEQIKQQSLKEDLMNEKINQLTVSQDKNFDQINSIQSQAQKIDELMVIKLNLEGEIKQFKNLQLEQTTSNSQEQILRSNQIKEIETSNSEERQNQLNTIKTQAQQINQLMTIQNDIREEVMQLKQTGQQQNQKLLDITGSQETKNSYNQDQQDLVTQLNAQLATQQQEHLNEILQLKNTLSLSEDEKQTQTITIQSQFSNISQLMTMQEEIETEASELKKLEQQQNEKIHNLTEFQTKQSKQIEDQQDQIITLNSQITTQQQSQLNETEQIKEIETLQQKLNEFEQIKQDAQNILHHLQNELIEQNNLVDTFKLRIHELEQATPKTESQSINNLEQSQVDIDQQREDCQAHLTKIQDLLNEIQDLQNNKLIQTRDCETLQGQLQELQPESNQNTQRQNDKIDELQNLNQLQLETIQKSNANDQNLLAKQESDSLEIKTLNQQLRDCLTVLKQSKVDSNNELLDQNNIIQSQMKQMLEKKQLIHQQEERIQSYEKLENINWHKQYEEVNEYNESLTVQMQQMEQLCEQQMQESELFKQQTVELDQYKIAYQSQVKECDEYKVIYESQVTQLEQYKVIYQEAQQKIEKFQQEANKKTNPLKLQQRIQFLEQKLEQKSDQSGQLWDIQILCEQANIKSLVNSGWIFQIKNQEGLEEEFKTQIMVFSSNVEILRQFLTQMFNNGKSFTDTMNPELQSFKTLSLGEKGKYLLGAVVLERIKLDQSQEVQHDLAGKLALQELWSQYILTQGGILVLLCETKEDLQHLERITNLHRLQKSTSKLFVLSPMKQNLSEQFELKDDFSYLKNITQDMEVKQDLVWIQYEDLQSQNLCSFIYQQTVNSIQNQDNSFVNQLREFLFKQIHEFFTLPINSVPDFDIDPINEGSIKLQLIFRDQNGTPIKQKLKLNYANQFTKYYDQKQTALIINDKQIEIILNSNFASKALNLKVRAHLFNDDKNQLVIVKFLVQGKPRQFWFYLNSALIKNLTPKMTQDNETIVLLFDQM